MSVPGICGEVREQGGLSWNEEKEKDERVEGGASRKFGLSSGFVGTLGWACLQCRELPCLHFPAPSQQTNHRTQLMLFGVVMEF